MKIETFGKASEIQDELLRLKGGLNALCALDIYGKSPIYDINGLPDKIKEKVKHLLKERILELEKEFEEL